MVRWQFNPKTKSRGIEWTHVWGRPGATSNPVKGCKHECKWTMPDGSTAICYAKSIAERVARAAYPDGFEHLSFAPSELYSIYKIKTPAGIFFDSMSDLLGHDVPAEWIVRCLETCALNPQHVFFVLTKNAKRIKEFNFPSNVWLGVSAPPSEMFGKPLTLDKQKRWYDTALTELATHADYLPVIWTSIEPLSWDCSNILTEYAQSLKWAVIGAASNGRLHFQPDENVLSSVYAALNGIPVFFKGNLDKGLAQKVAGGWKEEYPTIQTARMEMYQ